MFEQGRKQEMPVQGGRGAQLGPSGFNMQENVSRGGFAPALDSGAGLDVKTFTLVVIGICENIKRLHGTTSGGWAVLMSVDPALQQQGLPEPKATLPDEECAAGWRGDDDCRQQWQASNGRRAASAPWRQRSESFCNSIGCDA
jgi:hypothetical protein